MADPLSIAGSIAGLISLATRIGVTLNEFVTSAKSAPASIRAISDELTTLTYVLARVQKVTIDHGDGGSGIVDAGLLSDVLSGCMKSFRELESHVGPLRTQFHGSFVRKVWAQMSWPAKEKEIVFLAGRLGEYKVTLGITLQLKILYVTTLIPFHLFFPEVSLD
ncbi:hypothetical protein HOY80DRAFT_269612 [Tuber brumale]|nr:hypothetical protein HOY80DRAFT_269612 [Tuber brumale]